MQNIQEVKLAAETLRNHLQNKFFGLHSKTIGIILGTGLSRLARNLDNGTFGQRVNFSELPDFPQPQVDSHEGAFIFGMLGSVPVMAQLGRCHLYEGRTPAEICMGVRVMRTLGIKTLIITNAAGSLNPFIETGSVMLMCDMINHTGYSGLRGVNREEWGGRFPDMSEPFDKKLQAVAQTEALKLGLPLEKGVYIGVHGPEMETPAETRMYRQWGADAIGMSTVLEVAAAAHMGMKVLGFSCITNKNTPDNMNPVKWEEVLAGAEKAGHILEKLLPGVCAAIANIGEK